MRDTYRPGLEGVIAARTRLSRVDGEAGTLLLAGYDVETLAPRASFEAAAHLLWYDRLPGTEEAEALRRDWAGHRHLEPATLELLRAAARRGVPAMDALRMGAASLGSEGSPEDDARRAVAALPAIVAAYHRLRRGEEPVEPRPELGHAASFLHLLEGEVPSPERVRALETYLVTVADHGMNASTFAARVIVSTRSDLISALVGAIGALKGPLHGGAPGPALDTVFEIGRPERAEAVLRAKLERGERLMGFGHRVYRVRDPRAEVLRRAAYELACSGEMAELFELATAVETVALRLLAEHKPGRRLETNVEYYTALLLHGLGLEAELFTPTFAVGRSIGWVAHCFEQLAGGKLLRPSAEYVGALGRTWPEEAGSHSKPSSPSLPATSRVRAAKSAAARERGA